MKQASRDGLDRPVIVLLGRTNVGKSSLLNALTGQTLAIVSDKAGTTTDPVQKAMELLPLGPVMLVDTAGLDDKSELGNLRMAKTQEALRRANLVLLVTDRAEGLDAAEAAILREIDKQVPTLVVRNEMVEADEMTAARETIEAIHDREDTEASTQAVRVNALTGRGIDPLKQKMVRLLETRPKERPLISDLIRPGDIVLLVMPIDQGAPRGRLILPQQQVLREILDTSAIGICVQPGEIEEALASLQKAPRLVVTDSQVFREISPLIPESLPLVSFSMLFSRMKGDLGRQAEAAKTIDTLQDQDRILIAEGCTHHRQCDDIGSVKLPAWLRTYTGRDLRFDVTSGGTFPGDLSSYKLVLHCGACMLNTKEMQYRLRHADNAGIAITNYGTAIAKINGLLDRCLWSMAVLRTTEETYEIN